MMNCRISKTSPFGALVEPSDAGHRDIGDLDIETLRALFRSEHLVALRGFRTFEGAGDFAAFCERFGEISVWPFGKVLELVEQENPQDHIFDNNYVPMHWDGMYRPQVPEYQIFHCVSAPLPGQGGRTTFSNTVLALEGASTETKALWSRTKGVYRRKMEFYDSKTVSPIVEKHPHRGYDVLRYNEPHSDEHGHFVNPSDLEFTGVSEAERVQLHQSLKEALYSPRAFYAHEWQTGDVVIADNFTLLHGREKYATKSPRHIRRVHVLSATPFDNPGLESYQ